MTVSSFKYGLFCRKKYVITNCGCLEPNGEMEWLLRVRRQIPEWFRGTPEQAKESIEKMISELKPTWYSGEAERQAAEEKFRVQLNRLADYFFMSGLTLNNGEEKYTVKVSENTEVNDKIDFSYLDKQGKLHKVRVDMLHVNPYSTRAVKDVNKPQFALELLFPSFGLGDDSVIYEVWYLKGKNDSGGKYPPFEVKAGANVVSFCFEGYDKDIAYKTALKEGQRECDAKDCDGCKCRSICKGYSETPVSYISEEEVKGGGERNLTPEQIKVIKWVDGTLVVIAVPGAGKTYVLENRNGNLVAIGVNPSNILNLSFTKKAVAELAERIAKRLGIEDVNDPDMPVCRTLNGFGYDILKDNEKLLGSSLKLASDGERKALVKLVLNNPSVQKISGVNYAAMNGKFGLVNRVDNWITNLKDMGEAEFAKVNPKVDLPSLKFVTAELDMLFEQYGYIRYDDQIRMVVELFKKHPELVKKYSRLYKYIMVDEYQDCSKEQDEMVRMLAAHGNLVVVGDDDQSIYGWRGGSNEYLMNLSKQYPTVIMDTNFRSNQQIADVGNAVIFQSRERIQKQIKATRQAANMPVVYPHPDEKKVIGTLAALCNRYGGENVAVIARDNPTLNKFGKVLTENGVVHAECKDFLIDSKVFSVIRDVLRLHAEGSLHASESFTRLFISECGFAPVIAQFDESYADALIRAGIILDVNDSVANAKAWLNSDLPTAEFGRKLMKSYKAINYGEGASQVVEEIFNIWFAGTQNELVVLDTILDKFEEGCICTPEQALSFMDTLVEYEDTSRIEYDYGKGFCRLLTAHDSKGKEFDAVLILNADEFLKGGSDEDIRVLYVAVTRAKHTLVCTTLGSEYESDFLSILDQVTQKIV